MNGEGRHVVIIGAGFAGLFAAKEFFGKSAKVTIIDRNNYHTFNPLLYQVGAAEIEPDQIAYPVRSFIRKRGNVDFLMAAVEQIKFKKNTVITDRGEVIYDYLLLAPGSTTGYFGIRGADKYTMSLKSLDDALLLRNHILSMFEKASRCEDIEEKRKFLNFVIIGGGPTGVEFAGAFAEFVNGPLRKDFPEIDYRDINIHLVDAAEQILGTYSPESAEYVKKKLEEKHVKVTLGAGVSQVKNGEIILSSGGSIKSHTMLWTAGVGGMSIKSDVKLPSRSDGRVIVDPFLRPAGFENVFICGDMAYFEQGGKGLPMIAPVATQQGIHAAKNILRMIYSGGVKPFRYSDRGSMVTVGRNSAVTRIAGIEFRGFPAWVLWLFIHIFYLIGFRNKLLVMISWFSDYMLYERSGRMIIPSDMKK